MYSLSEAYEKGSGTTFITITMGVVTSLLFTAGLFLILNSHSNSQSQQLQQAIAAVKKSLEDSGDSSSAALLSLEQSLAAQSKDPKSPVKIPPINTLDRLTVKGATTLQGNVKFNKDATVKGDLDVKGQTALESDLLVDGTAEFSDSVVLDSDLQVAGDTAITGDITAASLAVTDGLASSGSLDVSGDGSIGGDLNVAGGATASSLSLDGDASVGGDLSVGGNGEVDGNLTVTGGTSTSTLATDSDATVGGNLDVAGDTTLGGNLDVTGTLSQGGTDLSDLFIQNAPSTTQSASIDIDGDISAATLTTTDTVTVGSDLAVTGDVGGGTLTIVGDGGIGGTLDITGDTGVGGALDVVADASVGGDLTVVGDVGGDTLTIASDGSVGGDLTVGGDVGGGTLSIGSDGSIGGDLDVSGTISQGGSALSDLYLGINDYAVGLNATSSGFATSTVIANGSPGRTRDCSGGGQHLRITKVDAGIITGLSPCVNDTNSDGLNYDLAENYPSTQNLEAGDVVSIDPANVDGVIKSSSSNDARAIGVVSTAPGYTLGSAGPGYPIALTGRVPVKVTNEGGAIAPGDYLTTASTPGYAKKAALGDKTIGQALASFNEASGTVSMFVNISGGNSPQQNLTQSTQNPGQISDASFNSLNVSGLSTLGNLQVTGVATVKDLQVTGQASVATLTVNGHIIGNDDTRGEVTIPAGSTSVHHDFNKAYDKPPVIVASPVNEPAAFSAAPTETGFDITLSSPASADIKFNYLVQQ